MKIFLESCKERSKLSVDGFWGLRDHLVAQKSNFKIFFFENDVIKIKGAPLLTYLRDMTKRKNFRDTSKKVFHENWQKSLYFKNVDFGLTHGGSRNLMENANFSTSFKVRYIFYFFVKRTREIVR